MRDSVLDTLTVDELWSALQDAKRHHDATAVRAIENRMRDLTGAARFAKLSDAQLDRRIASMDGNRAPVGLLAYSPGGNEGMDAGIADLPKLNRAIAAQQHVGLEAQRTMLLDERARRRAASDGDDDESATRAETTGGRLRRWVRGLLRPDAEQGLARQRARELADLGRCGGAVEHGRHHGGGHHGQFPVGG